ncbi:MAG: hypothetical protein R3E21_08320 [Caenibius sp.]
MTPNNNSVAPSWSENRAVIFNGQRDTHINTGEDYDTLALGSIFTMKPGCAVKQSAPAILPSTYNGHDARCHARQREVGSFVVLCVDIDKGDHPLARVEEATKLIAGDCAALIYSSAHARPGDMRWRVMLPLRKPLAFAAWYDAQCAVFSLYGRQGIAVDPALSRAAQPVYLPNVPVVHAASGTALREDGKPLYFQRSVLGQDAIDPSSGIIAGEIAAIHRQRESDERERQRIRNAAMQRRANRPRNGTGHIIQQFNAANDLVKLLQAYGYAQSPRHPEDWRSPHQTSGSYATRIMGDKWVSLSASDSAARLGENFSDGCFGDAYDLFAHFEHDGDHKSAFRALYAARRAELAYRKFGRPVSMKEAANGN